MFKWTNGKIRGVVVITPDEFEDYRGSYIETYDEKKYNSIIGEIKFVQDDISISAKDVLRGIHGNYVTSKLVSVLNGSVYSVIVDNRPDSETYRKWEAFILSGNNKKQLFIPHGIGNSILSLEDNTIYFYKQTTSYEPNSQFTLKWDDPELNIWWPIKSPILSERDFFGKYKE